MTRKIGNAQLLYGTLNFMYDLLKSVLPVTLDGL